MRGEPEFGHRIRASVGQPRAKSHGVALQPDGVGKVHRHITLLRAQAGKLNADRVLGSFDAFGALPLAVHIVAQIIRQGDAKTEVRRQPLFADQLGAVALDQQAGQRAGGPVHRKGEMLIRNPGLLGTRQGCGPR